jgi:hypothetical protein
MPCNKWTGGCSEVGLEAIDNSSKPCLPDGCNSDTCCKSNQIIIKKKHINLKSKLMFRYFSKIKRHFFIPKEINLCLFGIIIENS